MHENADDALLSNNFVKQVESGSMFKRDDIDYDRLLQITDTSTKFREFVLNSIESAQKKSALQASDNNGCCVKIKIVSQLNDASGNLKTGVFIKSQQFHILKHSCEINFPTCSVMLCISLNIIGFSNVLAEINKILNNSKKDELTNNNVMLKKEVIRSDDKKCNMITQKGASSCECELCSLYGLQFSAFVISIHEIENFNMLDIRNEYYFIKDSDDIETSNRSCMFLLCWWFVTNASLIVGKSNRIELLNCLIEKIRTV